MSDNYDDLPASPDSDGYTSSTLTVTFLRATISAKLYDELTDGDDAIAQQCIGAGVVRAESLLAVVGKKIDLSRSLHRDIARLLTVYELYVYNGDAKGGGEYLTAATDLVSGHYGDVEKARTTPPPIGAVAKPDRKSIP